MKKNDKKIENAIVTALHGACETLRFKSNGFCWLTHFVDYTNFPQSLKIIYVFETNQSLEAAKDEAAFPDILALTETRLTNEGIIVPRLEKSVFFDTEENGADVDSVSWCRKYS